MTGGLVWFKIRELAEAVAAQDAEAWLCKPATREESERKNGVAAQREDLGSGELVVVKARGESRNETPSSAVHQRRGERKRVAAGISVHVPCGTGLG